MQVWCVSSVHDCIQTPILDGSVNNSCLNNETFYNRVFYVLHLCCFVIQIKFAIVAGGRVFLQPQNFLANFDNLLFIMMGARSWKKIWCFSYHACCIIANWMFIKNCINSLLHSFPFVFSHPLFWAYISYIMESQVHISYESNKRHYFASLPCAMKKINFYIVSVVQIFAMTMLSQIHCLENFWNVYKLFFSLED